MHGDPTLTRRAFDRVNGRILNVLEALAATAYGNTRSGVLRRTPPFAYDDFVQQKPMSPDALGDMASLLVPAGQLTEFQTTGTRGEPRSIYWPSDTTADVSSVLGKIDCASRVSVTFSSAEVRADVFLHAHIEAMRLALPSCCVDSFGTQTDVARIVRQSDTVILTDYPAALARFIRLTKVAIGERELDAAKVRGTRLVARLTGEPMDGADLSFWHQSATDLGYELSIELRYGCTEMLGIARADFDPANPQVSYQLTDDGCFAEVLDPVDLAPLFEGRGVLCATSYRTSGTILCRYLLGDEVTISERDGARLVHDVRRHDALIVTGNTMSLSDLVSSARRSIGLEVCIEVAKGTDAATGVQHVQVTVAVPSASPADLDRARVDVEHRVLDGLKIRPAVADGFVILTMQSRPMAPVEQRRRKAWRLVGA